MYDYSTLHQIIELQYAKKKATSDKWKWGSFLDQSMQLGKGYVSPSNYLTNLNNILNKDGRDNQDDGNPLYLHNR